MNRERERERESKCMYVDIGILDKISKMGHKKKGFLETIKGHSNIMIFFFCYSFLPIVCRICLYIHIICSSSVYLIVIVLKNKINI